MEEHERDELLVRLDERMNHVVEFIQETKECKLPERMGKVESKIKLIIYSLISTGVLSGGIVGILKGIM